MLLSQSSLCEAPIRVVRITARLTMGGVARHVAWLTAGLQHGEFESVLVTGTLASGEEDMSFFAIAQGVEPFVIPEMSREISLKDAVTIWKLYRLCVRLRPDIVHTHGAKGGVVGGVAGLLYRWLTPAALVGRPRACRLVYTYHGNIFHGYFGAWKTRFFLEIDKLLARVATDCIIAISPQQYRELHEKLGIGRAEQFVTIPLGIDLSAFANWYERRHIVRNELGVNDRDILVGIVGRLTEIKNHRLFLQVVALFRETYRATGAQRVRFLVIGNGHLRHELEEQARGLGLLGDVTFLGTRDDPENFYSALDVVALTSRNEGTPLTLIEAMANARPVIATDVGGVVDLLGKATTPSDNRDCGYTVCERGVLVRPNDAPAFCRGLVRLIEDAALQCDLGKQGRLFIARNYAKERLVSDIASLYRALLTLPTDDTHRL